MTYEDRAKIVERELAANGGDMVAALRVMYSEACPRRGKSRLTDEQKATLRERRRNGAKLILIASEFGISEQYACQLVADVRPEVNCHGSSRWAVKA